MVYTILIITLVTSIEIFQISKFLYRVNLMIIFTKKSLKVLRSERISDHWKERIIPTYAWKLMKLAIQILMIKMFIFAIFLIVNFYFDGFIEITLSLSGLFVSIIFVMIYSWVRRTFKNE